MLTQAPWRGGTGMVSQPPTSVLQARSLSANGMSAQQLRTGCLTASAQQRQQHESRVPGADN